MGLTSEERSELIERLSELADGAERSSIEHFVASRWARCVEDLGDPDLEPRTRAGLARALVGGVDVPWARAEQALAGYPAALAEAGPEFQMVHHPAWVGLATIEVGTQGQGDAPTDEVLARAVERSAAGFRASTREEPARGEVLWAMAEVAEEVGWYPRSEQLLRFALAGPFAAAETRGQIELLLAMIEVRRGDAGGIERLMRVIEDEDAPDSARAHAGWIAAHKRLEAGDRSGAIALLSAARERVDEEEDPEIADRVDELLASWRSLG